MKRTLVTAAALAGLSAIPASAQTAHSDAAMALGKTIFDKCNYPITTSDDYKKTAIPANNCMVEIYDQTIELSNPFLKPDTNKITAKPGISEVAWGKSLALVFDQCYVPFQLNTTTIENIPTNIRHNTDKVEGCLYAVFEMQARSQNAPFDEGSYYTLVNANQCLGQLVGKYAGKCKELNTSGKVPVPLKPETPTAK